MRKEAGQEWAAPGTEATALRVPRPARPSPPLQAAPVTRFKSSSTELSTQTRLMPWGSLLRKALELGVPGAARLSSYVKRFGFWTSGA